jgi:bacillopeptidase F
MSDRPVVAVLLTWALTLVVCPSVRADAVDEESHAFAKIDSALQEELSVRAAEDRSLVPIIVTLEDQVDLARLDSEIASAGLDRRERAQVVIDELKSVAARSQPGLELVLDAWRARGEIERDRAYWLVNAFSLSATPSVIRELAARPDVARVFLDGILELERTTDERPAPSAPGQAEVGLVAVNARALWELGYTGAGVIVMNIDTGVDGSHAALASRWQGAIPGPAGQDAWFDPVNEECATPCDYDTHGTHTMGTLCGLDPATADTIGVAFGAKWIAAATLVGGSGHTSYSLAAFEWAVEPPGGSPRPPADVISCSWQDPAVSHAGDCGPNGTYWAVIDAFEAIGGAVVFSAGNAGPGPESITRPKNRISSPVNVWATGNVDANQPGFPIRNTSSRGPSDCDHVTVKPEAVAPGTNVRSSVPGGYALGTGTSMASPHAGGVIALLMEAFPWATGTEIKLALIATATDLGAPGEDNTYGHGLIDAGAAYEFLHGATDARERIHAGQQGGVSLSQNAPNPFNPSTSIRYHLPASASVTLKVYDAAGRVVDVLVDGRREDGGSHTAIWDGRTSSGTPAAAGMYFFRLEARPEHGGAGETVLVRQAVLLR